MNGLKTMFLPSSTIFSFLVLNMNILKKLGMNGACLIGEKDFWKEKKHVHLVILSALNV